MAVDTVDPITGAPQFLDSGAPDLAVDQNAVSNFAGKVGTRLIGTTAERDAYPYVREGLAWYNTTLDSLQTYDGSGWSLPDTAWTFPTLTAGSNISGNEFGYRRINGVVYLRGRVNSPAAGATIFTLPVGHRPQSGADNVRILDLGGSARVNFSNTGAIIFIGGGTSGAISFLGESFPVA